jgi:hypothetical protein
VKVALEETQLTRHLPVLVLKGGLLPLEFTVQDDKLFFGIGFEVNCLY